MLLLCICVTPFENSEIVFLGVIFCLLDFVLLHLCNGGPVNVGWVYNTQTTVRLLLNCQHGQVAASAVSENLLQK